MDASNLQPGCTLDDIDGEPPACDHCKGEGFRLTRYFDEHLCDGCYEATCMQKWVEHITRLGIVFGKLTASMTPDWYDPESFEGRLLELEEEING